MWPRLISCWAVRRGHRLFLQYRDVDPGRAIFLGKGRVPRYIHNITASVFRFVVVVVVVLSLPFLLYPLCSVCIVISIGL